MIDLDKLIEAVEAGEYHREGNGPAKYVQFGKDSYGIINKPAVERMEMLLGGKTAALDRLRAHRSQVQP